MATFLSEDCPACGATRTSLDSNFCEICGYNFVTKVAGGVPVIPPATGWMAIVTVDPALKSPGSPDPPSHLDPITIKLEKPVNLIGRQSDSRAIFPEIPLNFDDAVSHRHAVLNLAPEGSLTLRDIGSSNGTRLNDAEVEPMLDQPLKDADRLTLGHWTRIEIKALP